mmetsp:Transcript_23891/g.18239  ORF Transcript_23891/g.18239 Transcript_23891/m.18239 type:complete len:136 (+) Transcript_23891:802-1209(+)
MSFPFTYDQYEIFPNITACSYQTPDNSTWQTEHCNTTFDRASSKVYCICKHLSTYSVIQLPLVRPTPIPLIFLSYQNWPSFAVFFYMLVVFVFGCFFTIIKDLQDRKRYCEEVVVDIGEDGKEIKEKIYPLNAVT